MLGERFVVQDCLGGSDRAALYRARDEAAGGDLRVVQVLRRDAIGDPGMVRRFVAERAGLLTLLHPHLVTVEDIQVDSSTVTVVSEHVVGPNLTRLRHEYGGTLPPALAVEIARQVLLGLSALHGIGLVHSDVRPSAVLIPRAGDTLQTRLAGAALGRIGRGGHGRLDRLPRPVSFTAPEVLLGGRPSPASDVYAVGVLLYEALTGRTPFAGTSDLIAGGEIELAPPRPPAVPDELWAMLTMLLTKDPADRPSSAVSVADGLGALAPEFALLSPAAPMADPDPWSLRPATAPVQRRVLDAPVLVGARAIPADFPPLASPLPTITDLAGRRAGAGPSLTAGLLAPRRRVMVAAGVAAVLGLGALAGVVTVSGERGGKNSVAAMLPFADESYHTGALVVSRTWSLTSTGDTLRAQVTVHRVAAGGPSSVPEWLPSQLASSPVKASGGLQPQDAEGAPMLQLATPKSVGRTATYSYEISTRPGPATVARLQGWAVDQARQAADVRTGTGQPSPDTVAALAVGTPAVALTAAGSGYPLALRGGDSAGQVAAPASLARTAYTSDDPSVAVVDSHGMVQPRQPGTTVVTARLGPLAASATVLVTDPRHRVPLQFVQLSNSRLVVGSPPSAPARPATVTARAGNGTALVVWSRPDDGGQSITSYDIYADGHKVGSATTTHALIKGLVLGHSYRFTVVAHNRLGTSKPSPASPAVVPSPFLPVVPTSCQPAAPTRLSATLVSRTTVRVTWQSPPIAAGCQLSGVRIQAFPPTRSVVAAPGATSVDIPGLDAVTQYNFAVTAAYGADPAQTSARSVPLVTASGACWDGSYSDPCPTQGDGAQVVAAPLTSPLIPVTAAAVGAPVGTPVPVVTQSGAPAPTPAPGMPAPPVPSTPPVPDPTPSPPAAPPTSAPLPSVPGPTPTPVDTSTGTPAPSTSDSVPPSSDPATPSAPSTPTDSVPPDTSSPAPADTPSTG